MSHHWRDHKDDERYHAIRFMVIQAGLKKIFQSKKHVDCKFLVGPNQIEFEAHKLVLAMASDFMEDLLYSHTSAEPILMPDVDPHSFDLVLRFIYQNHIPSNCDLMEDKYYSSDQKSEGRLPTLTEMKDEDDIILNCSIINMWYTATKYGIHQLSVRYRDMIKVNLKCLYSIYNASQMLLNPSCIPAATAPRKFNDNERKNIEAFVKKCHKVFAVKTKESLEEESFMNLNKCFLQDLFELDRMNIKSELDLFQALVKYAHHNGWTPVGEFFKDENCIDLQKHVRAALKKIRFLSMTLKQFDSAAAKSGFFTESEVEIIRRRIAEESSPCVSTVGFSKSAARRYELLKIKVIKDNEIAENEENIKEISETNENGEQQTRDQRNKDIEKFAFSVNMPMFPQEESKRIRIEKTLGVTESFSIGNMTWSVIFFVRKTDRRIYTYNETFYEYTVYLKCNGSEVSDWRCYAQLDLNFKFGSDSQKDRGHFENIPWFCFKSDHKYCQTKPIYQFGFKRCRIEISFSPRHVSYNNKESNVSSNYGKDIIDYE